MKNRELKFRAFDNKEKKWLMGYEYPNLGGFSLFGECMLLSEWSIILNEFLFDRNGHKSDDLRVMQFTGLKDKNGKEIYEGDIMVKTEFGEPINRVVKWTDQNGAYFVLSNSVNEKVNWDDCLTMDRIETYGYKVIGNIYENPELIK